MPSGVRHQSATVTLALCTWPVAYVATGDTVTATRLTQGVLCGLLLSPDMDLQPNIHIAAVKHLAGGLVGGLWSLYWWPYTKAFHHRGASHWFVLGTLIRLIYIIPLLVVLLQIIPGPVQWGTMLLLVIGLILADSLHSLLDLLDVLLGGKL